MGLPAGGFRRNAVVAQGRGIPEAGDEGIVLTAAVLCRAILIASALLAVRPIGFASAAAEHSAVAGSLVVARVDRDGDGRGDVCTLLFRSGDAAADGDAIVGGIWFARPPRDQGAIFLAIRISAFGKRDGRGGYLALADAWLRAGSFDSRDRAFVKDIEPMNLAKMQTGAVRLRSVDRGLIEEFIARLKTSPLYLSARTGGGRTLALALRQLDHEGRAELDACLADIRERPAP